MIKRIFFTILLLAPVLFCFSQTISGNTSFCQGASTILSVTGGPPYQWERSTDGGTTWASISPGGTSANYTVTVAASYRVRVNSVATPQVDVVQNPRPAFDFTFNNNACSFSPVNFTTTITAGTAPYTFLWNFGDGGTSALQNPSHTYISLGCNTANFNCFLVITDANGCSTTVPKTVTVKQAPDVQLKDQNQFNNFKNCNNNPTPANPNYTLTVTNISPNASCITSYTLDWGDGTILNNATFPLTHTYTRLGAFNLIVTATGLNGCVNSDTSIVANQSNPDIGIATFGPTIGCAPLPVSIIVTTWQANSPGTTYLLNFGDNTSIPFNHPINNLNTDDTTVHTFSASPCPSPTFQLKITATNACKSKTFTGGDIEVKTKPTANFSIPSGSGCAGRSLCFTNTTVAGYYNDCSRLTEWLWDFGDGTPKVTDQNPCHTYILSGNYTVTLTASNPCGISSITKTVCVNNPPTSSFTLDNITGCAPLAVIATNTSNTLSNCVPATYLWTVVYTASNCGTSQAFTFTNSTTSASINPSFLFTNPGTYRITLSVSNGCAGITSSNTVIVKRPPTVTLANQAGGCASLTISPAATITNCGTGTLTYAWSFPGGNPTSATTATPGPVTYAAAGNYTISLAVTNECGITTVTQPLVVGAIPDLTVPPDVTLCAGTPSGALTFSSTTTGVTYSWTNSNTAIGLGSSGSSATIPSFTATNSSVLPISSTITVTARTSGGCTTQKTFVIFVNPRPIIANQTANICSGSAFTVTPPATNLPAGTTYSWAAPVVTGGITGGTAKADQTSISETLINPTNAPQTATYTVTPKSGAAGNCIGSNFTVTVTVNPINTITGTATDPTSCTANNGIISLAGLRANTAYSVSYVRNSGSPTPVNLTSNAGGVISINNLPPGTYTNITASAGGCASNAVGPFNLVSPAAPIAPTAGSNAPLCTGSTLNLTASGAPAGAVYNWTGPGGFTSTQQNPVRTAITTAMAGSYSVTVTSNGCISAPATINVVINATPPNPVVNSTLTYCQNETAVALTATAATGNTLNWYTTATGGTASSAAPTPLTTTIGATTYYVSQTSTTSPACESGRAAITVNVRAVPVITGTATDPTSCSSTDGTIRLAGLAANSAYTISYVKNSGTSTTVSLTANASGVVTISNISSGTYSTITATASGCASNAVGPFNLVSPAAPGTPTATSNSPLCAGGTLNLTAGNGPTGAVYNWTGPGGFTSAQQNPVRPAVTTAMAGSYSVTITSNGCTTAAATVNVVVNATPANPIVTSPLSYCQNETSLALTATATAGNTLNWYTTATGGTAASTAPVPVTTAVATTTYYVSQTSATIPACEGARAAILVAVKAVPVITGTATDPTSCSSTDGTIRISGLTANTTYNVDYVRNAGAPTSVSLAANSSGVVVISNLSAGTYTNIVATLNGCASNAVGPLNLVSPAAPGTPTSTNNGPLCAGTTLNLTANSTSAGAVFNWTGPTGFTSTQQNPVLTPVTTAMAGTYSVTVTSNGCTTLPATVNVVVNSAGVVTATSNSPVCVGSTVNLISSSTVPNVIYTWTGPNNFSSTLQNPSVTNSTTAMAGVYTVTGTSAQGGCTSTQTTTVAVSPIPNITAATFTDPVVCTAGTGLITLKGLTPNINYSVQYKKDGAAITANSRADADGSITIPGLSGGVYTNIAVSLSGCLSNEVGPFTLINTNASPATPRASGNSPLCVGATLNLVAVPGSTGSVVYEWSGPNGFTSNLQNPSILNVTTAAAGKYYVLARFNNCSSARDSVTISIGEYPVVNLGPDLLLTPGTRQQITPTILNGPIANYLWTPVTYLSCSTCANPVATVLSNITYTLRATNDFGCSGSDTLSIKVSCEKSQVFIPDAFTPDGDGINDVLFIRSAGNVTIKYFRIFNKWGQLVFEKNNFRPNAINDGWNGSIKGKAGQPDVFVYTAQVICENGSLFDYKGNISLLK